MDCDDEQPSCYREKVRKARKRHVCGDCRGEIKLGERYLYMSGIWDGTPENFNRCMDCEHLRCEIKRDTNSESCMFIGGLFTWLVDCSPHDEQAHRWIAMFNTYAPLRNSPRKISCPTLATALAKNLYPEESAPGSRLGVTPESQSPSDCNSATR